MSGKTAQLRTLAIKAWRERWTAGQFATQIKTVLGKGGSGDDYNLAECLLQQAMTGPAPNQLLLSLLDHCLASQLVSYSATINSVSKFTSFTRPHCTAALLQLLLDHAPFISCRSSSPEDCLSLATALVSLSNWALATLNQTVVRLVELRDSSVDISNLTRVQQLLTWLTTDTNVTCLSYTGRCEDTELHQELLASAKTASKQCDQIYVFAADSPQLTESAQQLKQLVDKMRSLEPSVNISRGVSRPESYLELSYSIHSILSYDAILWPTSDLTQLAGQLNTVLNIKGVSLSVLVNSLVRCCLLAMNEHDGFDVLKWDAFTLIKLPKLIQMIAGDNGRSDVVSGLKTVLESGALLDMTDARCKANTFELVARSMKGLLSDQDIEDLVALRQKQMEARKTADLKPPHDARDVNLIIKADSTLATIIQTFENRTTEQSDFESVLSVMFHIIKGSSFDLLLTASAANGSLTALVTKLLMFNEGCKESPGESVRVSQNRAALFDMTFLMLVYIIQCFGSEVVLANTQKCFFSVWARKCMVEPGQVKPLSGWTPYELSSVCDALMQQVTAGELRTQVVLWNNICNGVHMAIREMLSALESNVINSEAFFKMLEPLSNKMCCLPVCIASWMASHANFGHGYDTKITPLDIVDKFLVPPCESEEGDGPPYFQQRSIMMINIVKKMRQEMEDGHKRISVGVKRGWSGDDLNCDSSPPVLEADITRVWDRTMQKGRLDIGDTRDIARLYNVGGAEWFVSVLVEKLVGMVYNEDVDRATELVFSMLHVDLVTNTLALVVHLLPRYLVGEGKEALLVHPGGKCLAKLTVDCMAASLSMRNSQVYGQDGKLRTEEMLAMVNGPQQPVKLRKLNNGEAVIGDLPDKTAQEQLVDQAHSGLFQLLSGLGMDPVQTPRLQFVSHILEQSALLPKDLARQLLAPAPASLILQVVKVQPDRFSQEMILRLFDSNSLSGRKNMALILCLLRNIKASKKEP